jgi:hypothetical protein
VAIAIDTAPAWSGKDRPPAPLREPGTSVRSTPPANTFNSFRIWSNDHERDLGVCPLQQMTHESVSAQ